MSSFVSLNFAREIAADAYDRVIPIGWELDTTFNDTGELSLSSGFYAYALKPVGSNDGTRILAFRGTEMTLVNMKDLFADLSDIGRAQFGEASPIVNEWLANELIAHRNVELVGHSLGGALVQWAVNDTNVNRINTIAQTLTGNILYQPNLNQLHFTTFNAPGISRVLGGAPTDRTSVIVGEHHVEWSLAVTAH
ncbi:MAG: hypothetical protein NDI90_19270 [Nitrospira sp. BO4]|jgi:hypothetical protein|nr:hypothetical protein [Nitrospira sp. BO4]